VGGGALSFNGTSNWVDAGNSSQLQVISNLTMVAWINPSSLSGSGGVATKFYNTTGNRGYRMAIGGGTLSVAISNDGTNQVQNNAGSIFTNIWQQVAAVYTASAGTVTFYVNGSLAGNVGGFPTSIFNNSQHFQIGTNDDSTGANSFSGSIDDVRIYNRALSASEVQALYNAEK
jgi:hypothetical protein